MGYRSLRDCVADLERAGQLVRLTTEVDARLEAAEIHRRVFASGGPAVLFENVRGCQFPMVSNLFGSMERVRYIFRDTLQRVQDLVALKLDPGAAVRNPIRYARTPFAAMSMLPRVCRTGPVLKNSTTVSRLPYLQSWPDDGGPFVTLPAVYTEDVTSPGWNHSNLGMYRIQLSGNRYVTDKDIGLHYQLHRGIGIHHSIAVRTKQPFRVNVFIGGSPAMTVSAVMPLPEGMPEVSFAGALAGHRIPLIRRGDGPAIYADADFCISGTVDPDRLLPEGPFGDHLGYYSLMHDFPVLKVDKVWHRDGAIWPFTVVGRPPQEDTMFGTLIHEITGPVIPTVVPGVKAVHAVDAAGVHPLMLALGSERYVPYEARTQPREILTQANAILGQGQMSLAKYLWIAAHEDDPSLNLHDIPRFFAHVLSRVNLQRDLHFHTCTTIDTLDYTGGKLNEGSKLVVAAAGPVIRTLPHALPSNLELPTGFSDPRLAMPGVMCITAPKATENDDQLQRFCQYYDAHASINQFPMLVLVDDNIFATRNLNNFLWVTFTRSDPAADIDGIEPEVRHKHWGCRGAMVIDARSKPHHAPPLVEDPQVTTKVDAMAAQGGPLARWL
ncbi:MAG: UbiD family decarboxylase [Planctomycetales bacterium]|nr:UbiD family decarboxylase [Planctomycetales bacterium]